MSLCRQPQFLGGNPYFFCENLYQSVSFVDALMYHDIIHAIRIAMQFAKKSQHCVDASNTNRQILGATEPKIGLLEIGVLRHVARLSLILVNNVPRETKLISCFPKILRKKLVSMIKLLFRYTCSSVICLKSVSLRDTAVSSQKRQKSILDTDNPYQVACLLWCSPFYNLQVAIWLVVAQDM